MSRRYDTPERAWSTDSHLLPAGIRHVPRRDIPPQVRWEEPPVRPWQQGEPPRERPQQRVRFQDSYDEYPDYQPPPPRRPPGYHYPSGAAGAEVRRSEREQLESIRLRLARRELEELGRSRQLDEELEARERRRRESGDNYALPRPGYRSQVPAHTRARSGSPPIILRRRRTASADEADSQARRSRSSSPPDRFIKAELFSDPESYETGPATGTSSGYEPPPHVRGHRPPLAPESDDDESDTPWDSGSDASGELYDLYNERKIYEFIPSILSRNGSQDASATLGGSTGDISTTAGSGNGGGGPRGPSPDPSLGPKTPRPYRIYQSEYTGDGFPEGSHSVRLTAVLDSKRQRQPLFRWR